jgi:hypothetical protein
MLLQRFVTTNGSDIGRKCLHAIQPFRCRYFLAQGPIATRNAGSRPSMCPMPYGRRQCAAGNLFPYDYDADTFKVSSRVSSRVARGYIAALPRTVKLGTFCSPLSEKQSPGNLPIPGAREYDILAASFFLLWMPCSCGHESEYCRCSVFSVSFRILPLTLIRWRLHRILPGKRNAFLTLAIFLLDAICISRTGIPRGMNTCVAICA